MTIANRCPSEYQNWSATGQDGAIRRCTREEGHTMDVKNHDLHRWFGSGNKIKWPDSAALPPKGGGVS